MDGDRILRFLIDVIIGFLISSIFFDYFLKKNFVSYKKLEKMKIVVKDPLTNAYVMNKKLLKYLEQENKER